MSTRFITRAASLIGQAGLPTANSIRVDSDTDTIKFGTGASGTTEKEVADLTSTQTLTNKTLSGGTLAPSSVVGPSETLIALDTLTPADSGKTIFLNAAAEFAVTLPPALGNAGVRFKFIVTAAPVGASYTIITTAAAQELAGKVFSAADEVGDVENTPTATTITFVAGSSVIGDQAELECDGTSWFAICHASVTAGITITG